jgi:hypothetical protein
MFALSVALTVMLLLETPPSAVAGLTRARAGLTRLDQLTRLGLLQGRNLPVASALGAVRLADSAAVIARRRGRDRTVRRARRRHRHRSAHGPSRRDPDLRQKRSRQAGR